MGFRMNEQTAKNNYYQKVIDGLSAENVQENALNEFNSFVDKLINTGIKVVVVEDTKTPDTPDSIFPNNWISFHEDGRIGLYPMFAPNRRAERREEIFEILRDEHGFFYDEIVDFTEFEEHDKFLEGTGSIVLDRIHRKAYAALSVRTDERALGLFCEELSYDEVIFHAYQTVEGERKLIYHTNVMMCVASTFAVVCLDCVDDLSERENLEKNLKDSGLEVIEISEDQVNRFAGNMLQVKNEDGQLYLIMSTSAFESLNEDQVKRIESHCSILHSSLDTIEACGGGSARCMMAEVFLPSI